MKQARKRPLPTLAKLVSNFKRTDCALSQTLAFCGASNKRIARMEKSASKSVSARKGSPQRPATEASIETTNAESPPLVPITGDVGADLDLKALINGGRD